MRKVVLAAVLVLMAGGAQAVTLNVIGGQLHGASGVIVDGSSYDVQFLDGSGSVRLGATRAFAFLASQALLDQVFWDGPLGAFGSDWTLTNGCGLSSSNDPSCRSLTFYGAEWPGGPEGLCGNCEAAFADNGPLVLGDSVGCNNFLWSGSGCDAVVFGDTSLNDGLVLAVWSHTPVPEPSTALLLGLGLVGMAARRRV